MEHRPVWKGAGEWLGDGREGNRTGGQGSRGCRSEVPSPPTARPYQHHGTYVTKGVGSSPRPRRHARTAATRPEKVSSVCVCVCMLFNAFSSDTT
ncbi:hypothetical protein E2C01_057095 [Portunus trituberculatus]|uniref:Uncharacterized protein n=1 Tax=Portunus trituberculatus TaxID=210409 RepID=A0A5B7H2F1_PORTR|nr:hypothetical protein [Portunus trituberculatus]